jgi:hypothetical protein
MHTESVLSEARCCSSKPSSLALFDCKLKSDAEKKTQEAEELILARAWRRWNAMAVLRAAE